VSKKTSSKIKSGIQFPSNYRVITERGISFLSLIAILILILLIFLLSFNLIQDYQEYRKISLERQNINVKINSWSSILDKFPGYSDASFNMAVLYYQLNDFEKAKTYLDKTLIFDPNYPQAQKLGSELKKRGF